jgi:hypothetical protein
VLLSTPANGHIMNRTLSFAAGLLLVGATQVHAAQTNLIQNISLLITSYSQGSSITNGTVVTTTMPKTKLTTLNVIQALGASTGDTFSSTAKLLLVSPLPAGPASIVVKDGTNVVDVTGYFVNQLRSETVESSIVDLATGKTLALSRNVQRFMLQDLGGFPDLTLHFDARGLTTTKTKTLVNGQGVVIGEAQQVFAILFGDGDKDDVYGVMQVLIKVVGTTVEIK